MNSGTANLYKGRAGHLAAMSELLLRGWNVAIPEVDTGDDIFVVRHENGDFKRVQVKAAFPAAVPPENAVVKVTFSLSKAQLKNLTFRLTYIFMCRYGASWLPPIVIPQESLLLLLDEFKPALIHGSAGKNFTLRVHYAFQGNAVRKMSIPGCPEDLTAYGLEKQDETGKDISEFPRLIR